MTIEEIIETIHKIRREVYNNYDDIELPEQDRDSINDSLKDVLIILGGYND